MPAETVPRAGESGLAAPVWTNLVFNIGLMVVAATAAGLLARLARLPSILGFIVAGLVLGPVLGVVREDAVSAVAAELGVAFLLFFVGLEMSIPEVRSVGRTAVIGGVLQMGVCAAIAVLIALAFRFSLPEALLLGIALSFSSTVVTVKLLADTGDLSAVYGRSAVGILLVQDVAAMLVLAVLAGVPEGGAAGVASPRGLGLEVGEALLEMVLLLVAALALARLLLNRFLEWMHAGGESLFIAAIGWLFLVITVATSLGLSLEAGAFIAGVGLAQGPFREEIRRRVNPLLVFFIAFFFVLTGSRLRLADLAAFAGPIAAFAAFSLLVKPLVYALVLPRVGLGARDSLRAAVSLGTSSEFGILLVTLAVAEGLASPALAGLVAAVVLLTMAFGSPVQLHGERLVERLMRVRGVAGLVRGSRGGGEGAPGGEALEDHVVVVGSDPFAERVVAVLAERGVRCVMVAPRPPANVPPGGVMLIHASPDNPDVLEQAWFRRARAVVSTLGEPGMNRQIVRYCRNVVPCVTRAETIAIAESMEAAGAEATVIPTEAAAGVLLDKLGIAGGGGEGWRTSS